MGQTEEQYHLKWNDFNSSLTKCFRDLRDNCEMLDVSIISNGKTFKAHKLVLSACSPIFKNMLQKKNLNGQPFIFLHGVRSQDVQAILDFMYNGEVSVTQEDLRSFLSVAEDLRVKGLTQNEQNNVENKPEENKTPPRKRPRQSDDEEDSETEEQTELNPRDYSSVEHHKSPNHSPTYTQEYSEANPRRSSSSSNFEPSGNVSYHYLGGRDHDDPMTNLLVTKSDKGWHCPDCIHIATTKGNLKSHIMSGRHKLMEKSFQCRFCKRHYSTRQSMQVHISTNHRQERDLEMGIKMQNPAMEIQNEDMFETSANNPEVEIQGNFD